MNRSIDVEGVRQRISEMLETLNLKASVFADTTSLPRTTVSNILNGKTNTTIEVLNKILQAFPEWSAAWLLFGIPPRKGYDSLSIGAKQGLQSDLFDPPINPSSNSQPSSFDHQTNEVKVSSTQMASLAPTPTVIQLPPKEIEKILVFYSDSSYQAFYPENPPK